MKLAFGKLPVQRHSIVFRRRWTVKGASGCRLKTEVGTCLTDLRARSLNRILLFRLSTLLTTLSPSKFIKSSGKILTVSPQNRNQQILLQKKNWADLCRRRVAVSIELASCLDAIRSGHVPGQFGLFVLPGRSSF